MDATFPQDSDGDALRSLISTGSDLSQEMDIDFAVKVPNQETGVAFARVIEPLGFRTSVSKYEATNEWTCNCSRIMIPSYDAIIQIQKMLEEAGRPYKCTPDGWGTFGNSLQMRERRQQST